MESLSVWRRGTLMSRIFWPLLLEQTLNLMVGIVSTMLVSNAGPAAISGVSLVDQFNMVFIAVFNATATGATVVIAHMIGAGKADEAGETATQTLYSVIGVASILGIIIFISGDNFLRLLYGSAEAEVIRAGNIYILFSSLSYPFVAMYAVCAGVMRATGNSSTPLFCVTISNVVNLALALLLIYVAKLGVYAVSIAMLAARITSGMMALVMLRRGKAGFMPAKLRSKIDKAIMVPVLSVGVPSGIDQLMLHGVRVILTIFMSGMGTPALQANSIVASINTIVCAIGLAFCYVSTTIIGQAYGARDYKSLRQSGKRLCIDSVIFQGAASILVMIFFRQVAGLYNPTPEAYEITLQVTKYTLLAQSTVWSGAFVIAMMLRSVGEAKYSMIISLVALFTLRLTGAWFFGLKLGWGVLGIWMGTYFDWILRCVFFIPKFFGKSWERKAEKRWAENAAAEKERLEEELLEAESEEVQEAVI